MKMQAFTPHTVITFRLLYVQRTYAEKLQRLVSNTLSADAQSALGFPHLSLAQSLLPA